MRMIIEDRDGLPGAFYASMQERADQRDGLLPIGGQTDGHVTILAIELDDGRYGWLHGTEAGEAARALRQAAAVLDENARMVPGGSQAREVIAYLTRQAEHLEHGCESCAPAKGSQPA